MIDGEAFLLLTQADIVKIMSVKLGPALKIYNAILMFKNADDTLKWTSQDSFWLSSTQKLPDSFVCLSWMNWDLLNCCSCKILPTCSLWVFIFVYIQNSFLSPSLLLSAFLNSVLIMFNWKIPGTTCLIPEILLSSPVGYDGTQHGFETRFATEFNLLWLSPITSDCLNSYITVCLD